MDNEIKGEGNSLNYKYRMHDPRVGRFFSVDPLSPKYPHYSPYSFGGNKVIMFVELEGLEEGNPFQGLSEDNEVAKLELLTNARFEQIMRENGIVGKGIIFNRQKGYAFETAYFDSRIELNHNTTEQFATQFANYQVRPDGVRTSSVTVTGLWPVTGITRAYFYEVKASKSRTGLTRQIKGQIHAAANQRFSGLMFNLERGFPTASGEGVSALNIVTFAPKNLGGLLAGDISVEKLHKIIGVKSTVIREAARQNVQLNWAMALIDPQTEEIFFTPFIPLNNSERDKGILIPTEQIINTITQSVRTSTGTGVLIDWQEVIENYGQTNETGTEEGEQPFKD